MIKHNNRLPASKMSRDSAHNSTASLYGFLYIFLIISSLFYYFVRPEDISDYYSYLNIVNDLFYYQGYLDSLFEVGSSTILYLSYLISESSHDAVTVARIFTTSIFTVFLFILHRYYKIKTISLIIILALYGPLLAYVTIRATPAYVLVTLAVLEALRGRWRSVFLALLAAQFHISALIALPLIITALFQSRSNSLKLIERSKFGIIIFFIIAAATYFSFSEYFTSLLEIIINQIPYLNKYTAYIETTEFDTGSDSDNGLYHLIYFSGCTILLALALTIEDKNMKKIRMSAIVGYAIFLFLQFSPVTAFRFSIFWTIPVIVSIPWEKYLYNPFIRTVAAVMGLLIFIVQLNTILFE